MAFKTLQTALITAPVLAYPDVNRPFIIDTDASNIGIGAVLSQQGDSGEQQYLVGVPMERIGVDILGRTGCSDPTRFKLSGCSTELHRLLCGVQQPRQQGMAMLKSESAIGGSLLFLGRQQGGRVLCRLGS
ncbi:hypothetical protein AAFF_G00144210 [Aldrovandia affinis]|uniref:Reverse transcriptase/retrotransposon-derived protein RNase H-like domain-containing protein n=1 Tax=Aldrovandia affinis TaxID=143900 RepID=A0AAD7WXT2_9TELE|nr:hypothetical protein AAFF_G00144210 [Aldrovandia affinis]